MNRKVLAILGAAAFNVAATPSPTSCIADTLYQEARGANAEELAMVGNTIINWHKRTGTAICKVTKTGYHQRRPPATEHHLYEHIAVGVVSGQIRDLTRGADHFNEGRRPAWPGKITRQTRRFVFYRLADSR